MRGRRGSSGGLVATCAPAPAISAKNDAWSAKYSVCMYRSRVSASTSSVSVPGVIVIMLASSVVSQAVRVSLGTRMIAGGHVQARGGHLARDPPLAWHRATTDQEAQHDAGEPQQDAEHGSHSDPHRLEVGRGVEQRLGGGVTSSIRGWATTPSANTAHARRPCRRDHADHPVRCSAAGGPARLVVTGPAGRHRPQARGAAAPARCATARSARPRTRRSRS